MGRTCSRNEEMLNEFQWEKPEDKRPLGRPRRRWEGNIKMELREVGCDPEDWTDFPEDSDQW